MKNIYLCGFMGCGKTTIARVLGQRLALPSYDLDQLIVEQYRMTIPQMFARGEAFFRQAETQVLQATGSTLGVYATGGGILTQAENGPILRKLGTLVFLDTPFDLCYERIQGDENRPNAVSRTKEELLSLYRSREAAYRRWSHLSVPEAGTPEQVADAVLQKLLSAAE